MLYKIQFLVNLLYKVTNDSIEKNFEVFMRYYTHRQMYI